MGMKISISLPASDVDILDAYARAEGLASRSAAVHRAVGLLRLPGLEDDYAAAWAEWEASGDEAAWTGVALEGLADAQG